ncbi:MAG TPA: methyltransferase domain-containing protein [Actinomycetota bacterium]|nr:methyltransferase domain-containing protein [Actinomycetota bacterium]
MEDARRIHEDSLKGWGAVAPAWLSYADDFKVKVAPVANWMLEHLELEQATSVLELACGAGDLSMQIHERLAPGVRFVASDFAPEMVDATRTHAAALGAQDVDFRVLDAQALALESQFADRVACRFGYMLMPEPDKAFEETHRVLGDGGHVVAAVWGPMERNAWLMVFGMALMQAGIVMGDDPFGPGGVFSLADPSVLRAKVEGAGFASVEIEEIPFTYDFDDFDSYWAMQSRLSGSAAGKLQEMSEEERTAIKESARASAEAFHNDSGFQFPALSLGVVGTK